MAGRFLVYGLLCIATTAAPGFAADQHYVGVAYALSNGQIAYREEHWIYEINGVPNRLVLYRCASGEPFARKLVKNVPDAFAPDFDFIDGRDGYREGVRTRDGAREVYVQKSARLPLRSAPLPLQEGAVIDAGFDAYVSGHWPELVGKHVLKFAFLVPSRFGYFDLKLNGVSKSVVDGEPATNLRLGMGAWFGFAAPSIDLTYLTAGLRLRRFQGIGNIHDSAGKNQIVSIEFPASLQLAPPKQEDIHAAAAMPLVGTCTA
jgi:hypothetical protein